MNKKLEYMAVIINGKPSSNRATMIKTNDYLNAWEGEELRIKYEVGCSRTAAQNDFFHSCILRAVQRILAQKEMPSVDNEEFVKEIILKKPYLTVNRGTPEEYIRPTSALTTEEFWQFCNWCIDLIVRLGGNLNEREAEEYQKIITQFHLDKAIDESFSRD